MSVTGFIRKCLDAGMPVDMALSAAEAFESEVSLYAPVRSKGAERQARYRQRKAEQVAEVASQPSQEHNAGDAGDAKRIPPTPPKKNYLSPPLKGGISPLENTPPAKPIEKTKPISAWVGEIWQSAPRPGRERSGKRDLESALKTAQRKGYDLAMVAEGVAAYYASPDATKNGGEYAKGVHVVVSSGRWEAFAPDPDAPPPDQPSPADEWAIRIKRFAQVNYWNDLDWGPRPGKPGCKVPPEILMAHGFIPPPRPEIAA